MTSLQSIQSSVREEFKRDFLPAIVPNKPEDSSLGPVMTDIFQKPYLDFLDSAVSQAWEAAILEGLSSVKGKHVVAKKSYPSESWDAGYHDALFAVEKSLINLLEAAKSPTGEDN